MGSKILYIEDTPQNMRLVKKMLNAGGYEMIGAEDGSSGLAAVCAEMPDLILLDINLPDIDGLEVTGHIRRNPAVAHIPIIALTANAMAGDRDRFLSAGCDGYIAKPFSKAELLHAVAYYLGEPINN